MNFVKWYLNHDGPRGNLWIEKGLGIIDREERGKIRLDIDGQHYLKFASTRGVRQAAISERLVFGLGFDTEFGN